MNYTDAINRRSYPRRRIDRRKGKSRVPPVIYVPCPRPLFSQFILLAAAAPLPHPTRSRRRRSTSPPPYAATVGPRHRSTPSSHARAAAFVPPARLLRRLSAHNRHRVAAACAPPLLPPARSSTSPHPSQANQATSPTQRKFATRKTLLVHPRLARQVLGVLPEPSRSP